MKLKLVADGSFFYPNMKIVNEETGEFVEAVGAIEIKTVVNGRASVVITMMDMAIAVNVDCQLNDQH